jgi:hypothetical protein
LPRTALRLCLHSCPLNFSDTCPVHNISFNPIEKMNLDNGTTTNTKKDTILHVEIPIRSSCPTNLAQLRIDWEKYYRLQQTAAKAPHVAAAAAAVLDAVVVAQPVIVVPPESLSCHVAGTITKETCEGKIISTTTTADAGSAQGEDMSIYTEIRVYPYFMISEEAAVEELQPSSSGGGGDEERTACCESIQLPHSSLHGLWDNLIFEDSIKQDLLKFAHSALLFADLKVNEHIVHWNRLILLHGSK